ncbi:MAG TPA: extracellular solute-binding protein [Micromonosporaceae bacterium]|nr:extracellular solute-binding protein [Micromonosporaceae bacterium]
MTQPIDRRSLLKLFGAGALTAAAGPALAGCGDGGPATGGDVGNAGKNLAAFPAYLPFAGPKPDGPGDEKGVQPLYLNYPQQVTESVTDTVGDGSDVSVLVTSFGAPPKPVEGNKLWQAVNAALKVNLKIVAVPDAEYVQKMTTLMASGGSDLPDVIMFTNHALPNAHEFIQATCADLSELIGGDAVKEYPNLANIPKHAWQGMGRIGGKIYGIPLERPAPANSMFVNRTAMDAAGIPKDWNTEQFLAGMKQLSGNKKWGTGAAKTQFVGVGAATYYAGSMGAPNVWQEKDGKFSTAYDTPQFEEAIGVMRKLAESGSFHPDSLTTSATDMKTLWWNGTVASTTDGFGAVAPQTLTSINGRFALDLARPFGPNPTPWRGKGIFGFVVFKKASPDRIKLLLRVVNYLAAPFGSKEYELTNYGVEGLHFTKDANGIKTTDLFKTENTTNLPIKYVGQAPTVLYLPGYPDVARAVYEWEKVVVPKSVSNPADGLVSPTDTAKRTQLDQLIGDAVAGITFGRKPLSAWKEAVTQWRQAGGDQIADELAKEHAAAK